MNKSELVVFLAWILYFPLASRDTVNRGLHYCDIYKLASRFYDLIDVFVWLMLASYALRHHFEPFLSGLSEVRGKV